jgi:hypothetical protein
MPDDAGNPARQASSPKHLSKVSEYDSFLARRQFQYVLILAILDTVVVQFEILPARILR